MLLTCACGTTTPVERPVPPTPEEPAVVASREPVPGSALYGAGDALQDALAGQWEYVGTGPWPTIERSSACVFRNDRVLVVNVYCTVSEIEAFAVQIYSPERGRVRIYAEGKRPVRARQREEYFTFLAESEPPPEPGVAPKVELTMSFDELAQHEKRRHDAMLPGCYGGERHEETVGGCLGALTSEAPRWAEQNRAFLERPGDPWYRLVREMHALAARHGRDPEGA